MLRNGSVIEKMGTGNTFSLSVTFVCVEMISTAMSVSESGPIRQTWIESTWLCALLQSYDLHVRFDPCWSEDLFSLALLREEVNKMPESVVSNSNIPPLSQYLVIWTVSLFIQLIRRLFLKHSLDLDKTNSSQRFKAPAAVIWGNLRRPNMHRSIASVSRKEPLRRGKARQATEAEDRFWWF